VDSPILDVLTHDGSALNWRAKSSAHYEIRQTLYGWVESQAVSDEHRLA